MEDNQIIELYWSRSEKAIFETERKYGKYCTCIANNILNNIEDSRECVNDTYLNTWNTIPPQKPNIFKLFLGKITRNLALDRYEMKNAKKRIGNMELSLEELKDCIPDNKIDQEIRYTELVQNINEFLKLLPKEKRKIFLERYWHIYSIKEISSKNNISESNVTTILQRIRNQLKSFLKEGDFYE